MCIAEVNSQCGKTSISFFHVACDYLPLFKFIFQALSPARSFFFFPYTLQSLVLLKCFKMLDHVEWDTFQWSSLSCTPSKVDRYIGRIFLGVDFFHIPWSPRECLSLLIFTSHLSLHPIQVGAIVCLTRNDIILQLL